MLSGSGGTGVRCGRVLSEVVSSVVLDAELDIGLQKLSLLTASQCGTWNVASKVHSAMHSVEIEMFMRLL